MGPIFYSADYYHGFDADPVVISRKMWAITTTEGAGEVLRDQRKKEFVRDRSGRPGRNGGFPSQTYASCCNCRGIMVERDVISRMESGSRIVTDFEAVAIAEVLEVPVLWLLGKE